MCGQVYIKKPGPSTHRSHFAGIYLSSCLLFQIVQFFLLLYGYTRVFRKRFYAWLTYLYWITVTLSGFMCGVGYAFTPKPDTTAIEFLSFLVGMISLAALSYLHRNQFRESLILQNDGNSNKDAPTTSHELPKFAHGAEPAATSLPSRQARRSTRGSRFCFSFCRIINRFLKVVHWAMSILFISGAITLALAYRYPNPYVKYACFINAH